MLCSKHNCFMCPHCGHTLNVQDVIQSMKKDEARGYCSQCKIWTPFQLPSIRKKIVYLDQSLLSDMCREETGIAQRLYHKLVELKRLQKIFLVISDIHCNETSAIPVTDTKEKIWKLQNTLANGRIAGNLYDVFAAQTRRMLTAHDGTDSFPITDIGLDDPHRWQVGMNIEPTNSGLIKLHQENTAPRDLRNEKFRNIFDQQVRNIPDCRGVRDCLNHVTELWRNDIQQGINAYQQQCEILLIMQQLTEDLETGKPISHPIPHLSDAPFRRIVGDVVNGLNEPAALQRWSELLKNNPILICSSLRIRIAFEAELLWSRWQGHRSNPKKFNKNFGVSCQNDIDHISAFVPYVDALTTDDDMRNLCKREVVIEELARFSTKIFSKNNYDEFEVWLDSLLTTNA